MLSVSGANLFGQWKFKEKVLKKFQKVFENTSKLTQCDRFNEVIYVAWSYTLWRSDKRFYLTGSWLGESYHELPIEVPKELISKPTSELYLIGSDNKLVLFSILTNDFWVLVFEVPFFWSWSHKKIPVCNMNELHNDSHKKMKLDNYVSKAVSSFSSVFCLMSNGSVFELPNRIDTAGCFGKVIDIVCGYEHTVILTDTGHVYTWGNGRRCQLGNGSLLNNEVPTLVEGLAGIKITKIRAGGWHSLALSEFGDLYAWGWNDTGQLGIKISDSETICNSNLKSLSIPTIVEFYNEKDVALQINVKDMACGSRHSAVILSDNTLWTTGLNSYGQLGYCPDTITFIEYFKKSSECYVNSRLLCGPWTTVIINPP